MSSFKPVSRGVCVRELQELLQIEADGVYGSRETAPKVRAVQAAHGLPETGFADAALYGALGSAFPDLFRRCLSLTNGFEGTYYGDCNRTDIDNAGLTMGVIGFTSKHGEVQKILIAYHQAVPSMLEAFDGQRRVALKNLLETDPKDRLVWDRFFYGPAYNPHDDKKDPVLPDVWAAFRRWGVDPVMRELQLRRAREQYWESVPPEVGAYGFDSGTDGDTMAAHALLFDIHVQNGSVKPEAKAQFDREDDNPNRSVRERMLLLARAVADASSAKWREDVFKRKSLFAIGEGRVHGSYYSLDAQALT